MKNWNIFKKIGFCTCYGMAVIGILGMFLIDKNTTKSWIGQTLDKISYYVDKAKKSIAKISYM